MKFFVVCCALLVGFSARAEVEERIGKIYPLKTTTGEPLFLQKMRIERGAPGNLTVTGTITDPTGVEALREKAVIENGRIKTQTMEQLQIGERYELEVVGGDVKMKSFKTGGVGAGGAGAGAGGAGTDKLDGESTEKLTGDFVTGPGMEVYLLEKMALLEKGDTVAASFGIFEVLRSVGFEFRKESQSLSGAAGAIGVRMKPASFWLKLLVDTIYFDLDRASGRLLRFRGRTPVRVRDGKEWKPLDAEIVYELVPSKGK